MKLVITNDRGEITKAPATPRECNNSELRNLSLFIIQCGARIPVYSYTVVEIE